MDGRGTRRSGTLRRLGVVALVIAIGAGTTGAGAAIPHDVPATPPYLTAIACEGPSFCVAVGSPVSGVFAARYDGAAWTPTPTPTVTNGALNGVACTSSASCFAVGRQGPHDKPATLIEWWNGFSWHIVPSPNRTGSNDLTGISCVSASFCAAAGSTINPLGSELTLVEHWNGNGWRIVSSPNFHGYPYDTTALRGISCATAKQCFAVGASAFNDELWTFIIRWNGRAWSASARQQSAVAQQVTLSGVACPAATACTAVGGTDSVSVVLKDQWNGSTWKLTEGKTPPNDNYDARAFNAVSCTSATACLAVGSEYGAYPYAQRWNGSSWRQTSPPQHADNAYGFGGVSCVAADDCYAAGGNIVEHWQSGHWTTVATF